MSVLPQEIQDLNKQKKNYYFSHWINHENRYNEADWMCKSD